MKYKTDDHVQAKKLTGLYIYINVTERTRNKENDNDNIPHRPTLIEPQHHFLMKLMYADYYLIA